MNSTRRCTATPSCYMYMHSIKNINFKKWLALNYFLEFNVEQRINELKIQNKKLWLVDIQPEKTTRVFLVSTIPISMDITYVPGLWEQFYKNFVLYIYRF